MSIGIGKGYLFVKNGRLKGKRLDIGLEPPRIKIFDEYPRPHGMNDNMEHDGYSGYRENYSRGEPHLSSSLPSQHEIGFARHN